MLPLSCFIPPPQITKFQAASEIPARFIERNVSLRGKVCSITERGVEVEHVPIYLPVLSSLLSKQKGDDGLSFEWNHEGIHTHTHTQSLYHMYASLHITYWESESCYMKNCNFSLCCTWSLFLLRVGGKLVSFLIKSWYFWEIKSSSLCFMYRVLHQQLQREGHAGAAITNITFVLLDLRAS